MNNTKSNRQEYLLTISAFVIIGIVVGALVYMANENRGTLVGIFKINYLIPVMIYSLGTVLTCYLIYYLFKKKISKVISFIISIILGVPLGLHLVIILFKAFTYLVSWVDIWFNTG